MPSTLEAPARSPPQQTSSALAKEHGPYPTYEGSPVSKGILQHDMWGVGVPSKRWDWDGLRANIKAHGVRNSLLLAPMPTASTSQVGGLGRGREGAGRGRARGPGLAAVREGGLRCGGAVLSRHWRMSSPCVPPDPGQQRVLRTLHLKHLRAARAQR